MTARTGSARAPRDRPGAAQAVPSEVGARQVGALTSAPGGASMPRPKQLTDEIRGDCGVPQSRVRRRRFRAGRHRDDSTCHISGQQLARHREGHERGRLDHGWVSQASVGRAARRAAAPPWRSTGESTASDAQEGQDEAETAPGAPPGSSPARSPPTSRSPLDQVDDGGLNGVAGPARERAAWS